MDIGLLFFDQPSQQRAETPLVTIELRTRSQAFPPEDGGGEREHVVDELHGLTPNDIGHAFPTGDMFRQGRFESSRGEDRAVEVLQRWFARVPSGDAFYMAEVDDTRVPPRGAHAFSLALPPGEGEIHYRLDLHRLDPRVARRRGLPESLVRIPVISGRVRW